MIKKTFFLCITLFIMNVAANSADTSLKSSTLVDSSQQIADKIIKSKIPVLVDFWAVWCMPCRMLNPVIKNLEEEYKGRILFIKVNVDIHRAIASYFSISAIPAVYIINNKTVQKVLPGLNPKEAYATALNEILASAASVTPAPEASKESPQQ